MKARSTSMQLIHTCFSPSRLLSTGLYLAITMFCAVVGFCQDPPSVADGMDPSATYHGGDFDFVDMATGRLHLRIPLLEDHSQRGQLNFTYALSYSSIGTWWAKQIGHTGQTYIWQPPNSVIRGVEPLAERVLLTRGSKCIYDPDFSAYECEAYVNGLQDQKIPSTTITTTPDVQRSIDGSGILSTRDSSLNQVTTDKNGIQWHFPVTGNYYLQDPNGNQMTLSPSFPSYFTSSPGSTMTDTLGRVWSYATTTDYSGCPVTAVSAIIWTTPGPNGASRTFKFCYSSISYHTAFNHIYVSEAGGTVQFMTGIVLPDGKT